MENPFPEIPAESAGLLTLGVALGENHAFGVMSGRTAAAQAACLERLREEKLFQALEPTWESFCPKHLRISRAEADKTIRLWQEFGAGYFEMSALTRVSAETYRAIAPAVRDGALHVDGEAIALNVENSRRVSAAVARLRREIPRSAAREQPPEVAGRDPIDDVWQKIVGAVAELRDMARKERDSARWEKIAAIANFLSAELAAIAKGEV